MARWLHSIKLKDLLTEKEDHASIQKSMDAIADELSSSPWFVGFNSKRFRKIPKGDDVIGPVDYANKLISSLYDYADEHRIWIG